MTRGRFYRVRHRAPWWSHHTATRVRYYSRSGNAFAAMWRLEAAGHQVELSRAHIAPWAVIVPAPWSAEEVTP